MWQFRVRDHILATMSVLFVLLFSFAVADAKGPGQLPNVMVLATGGTIAGTGESSTTVVGYTAATVGIERLLNAVPELKTVANVKGEQVFQIASENMNNDLYEGMRVKKFFRDQHFFSSYVSRGLARAQFCIDGTAGPLLGRAFAVNPQSPQGRAGRREGLTAKARAERQ